MFDILKQGAVAYNLPSASFTVSASFASEFYLDNQTLTTASKATISTAGASSKQQLTFWLNNVDYPYTLIDGYSTSSIFSSSVGVPAKVDVGFDGTQWSLSSFKRLALDSEPIIAQDPAFAGLGLVLDIDPTKFYTLHLTSSLTGSSIQSIDSVNPTGLTLLGSSHAPTWDRSGWNAGVPALMLTGSATPADLAIQWLYNGHNHNSVYDALACTASTWAAWTIFVVFKLNQIETEMSFVNFTSLLEQYPNILLYTDNTNFRVAVYNDSLGSSDSTAIGNVDLNKHVMDVSADGAGGVSGSIDGGTVFNCSDVRPKTVGGMSIGTAWLTTPNKPVDQLNGKIARILVFNQNLSSSDRTRVRQLLANKYGLSI